MPGTHPEDEQPTTPRPTPPPDATTPSASPHSTPPPPRPDRDDPTVLWLAPGVWIRRDDLEETFVRGSGPGGQCVNKLATAVLLRVPLASIHGLDERRWSRLRRIARSRITREDDLLIQAREFRSQRDNRRACEERLVEIVRRAWELPPPRKKTRPSKAQKQKRLDAKKRQGEKKQRRSGSRPRLDD
jgi:ribosome-associated protein